MASNRKLSWSNAREVRRSLATINNMLLNDKIEADKARAIVYTANTILSSIRIDDQEKQIQELKDMVEELQKEKNNNEQRLSKTEKAVGSY